MKPEKVVQATQRLNNLIYDEASIGISTPKEKPEQFRMHTNITGLAQR